MGNKNKITLFAISFITFLIVSILIIKSFDKKGNDLETEYFREFPLKSYGTICNIVKGEGSLKYFVTIKVDSSNIKNYKQISPLNVYFAIQNDDFLIFLDHYENYKIGDYVCIGCDDNIIIVKDQEGIVKFEKRRDQAMLFKVSQPNYKMIELLEHGCAQIQESFKQREISKLRLSNK